MSRVGKKPIPLPDKVTAVVAEGVVRVHGPRGELTRTLPGRITAEVADGVIVIRPVDETRMSRSLWGLTRTLVANMVLGVAQGFSKELEIVGVGYKAEKQGQDLKLALGFSHPCIIEPPAGITFDVPSPQLVAVRGNDKELVGLVASRIRALRPPEPYKGKGVKYRDEHVRRKVRKGAVGGGTKG